MAQVREVRRIKEFQDLVERLGRGRDGGLVSSSVPLSCRILSKLSQEINKNEERRSIFARK